MEPPLPHDTVTERLPADAPVEDRVRALLADHLGHDAARVIDDARLVQDLGADSLDFVEIAITVEEQFSIEVPDDQVESARTVGDIVKLVRSLVDAAAAKAA